MMSLIVSHHDLSQNLIAITADFAWLPAVVARCCGWCGGRCSWGSYSLCKRWRGTHGAWYEEFCGSIAPFQILGSLGSPGFLMVKVLLVVQPPISPITNHQPVVAVVGSDVGSSTRSSRNGTKKGCCPFLAWIEHPLSPVRQAISLLFS